MIEPHGHGGIHNYTLALATALSSKNADVAIVGTSDGDWADLPRNVVVRRRLEIVSFGHPPCPPRCGGRAASLCMSGTAFGCEGARCHRLPM